MCEQTKYRFEKKEADKLLAELPAWWKQVERYDYNSRRIATPGMGEEKKKLCPVILKKNSPSWNERRDFNYMVGFA